MLLAWLAVTAVVVAIAPRLAGDDAAEFGTKGSESQQAAELVAERFPGRSGDTIDVVWQARAGARSPPVRPRVDHFLEQAQRLEGIAGVEPARVSRGATIALARLELDREAAAVPSGTSRRLVELAADASGTSLRIELGGEAIENAEGAAVRRSRGWSPRR